MAYESVNLDVALAKKFSNKESPNDLIIQGQKISRISTLSSEYASLRTLDVSFNELTNLDGIEQFPRLRHLSSYCCRLEDVEMISQTTQLVSAMLQQNGLSDIPSAFRSLNKLRELRLDRNKLTEVRNLSSCSSLKVLDLSRNSLRSIEGLAGLQSLEELRVNHNMITSLRPLKSLPSLRELQVSFNQLTTLEGLQLLPTLESVHAEGNKIATLRIPLTYTHQGKTLSETTSKADSTADQGAQVQGQGRKVGSGAPTSNSSRVSLKANNTTNANAASASARKGTTGTMTGAARVKRSDSVSSTVTRASTNSTGANQAQLLQEVVGLPQLSEVLLANNCIVSLDGLESLGSSIEVLDLSSNSIDGEIKCTSTSSGPSASASASNIVIVSNSTVDLSASVSAASGLASGPPGGISAALCSLTKLSELKLRGNPISRNAAQMELLVADLAMSCPQLRNVDSMKIITEEEEREEQQQRELRAQTIDMKEFELPSPPRSTAPRKKKNKKVRKDGGEAHSDDSSDENDDDFGEDVSRDDGNKTQVNSGGIVHPHLSLKDTLSMEELQFMEGQFSSLLSNCKGTLSSLLRLPADADVDAAVLVPAIEAIVEKSRNERPELASSGSLRLLVEKKRREDASQREAEREGEEEEEKVLVLRSMSSMGSRQVRSMSSMGSRQQLSRASSALGGGLVNTSSTVSLTWRRKSSASASISLPVPSSSSSSPIVSIATGSEVPDTDKLPKADVDAERAIETNAIKPRDCADAEVAVSTPSLTMSEPNQQNNNDDDDDDDDVLLVNEVEAVASNNPFDLNTARRSIASPLSGRSDVEPPHISFKPKRGIHSHSSLEDDGSSILDISAGVNAGEGEGGELHSDKDPLTSSAHPPKGDDVKDDAGDAGDADSDSDPGIGSTFIIETIPLSIPSVAPPILDSRKGAIGLDARFRSLPVTALPSSRSGGGGSEADPQPIPPMKTISAAGVSKDANRLNIEPSPDKVSMDTVTGRTSHRQDPPPPLPLPAYAHTHNPIQLPLPLLSQPLPRPMPQQLIASTHADPSPKNSDIISANSLSAAFKKFRIPSQLKSLMSDPSSTLEDTILGSTSPRPTSARSTQSTLPAHNSDKLAVLSGLETGFTVENKDKPIEEATSSPRSRIII